jgi:hypothetical protein
MIMNLAGYVATQRAWSEETFGPGTREKAITDHIKKELVEVEQARDELNKAKEWVDVAILALDAMWRLGISPEAIESMFAEKQRVNLLRKWPDWRGADPTKAIEHDRSYEPGL